MRQLEEPGLLHGRYPPLLPALTAGLGWLLGTDDPLGPQVLAAAFATMIVGVLVTAVTTLSGWVRANLGPHVTVPVLTTATVEIQTSPLGAFALTGVPSSRPTH